MTKPTSPTPPENDGWDVDEINRKIRERIARKSSPVGRAAASSMNSALESLGAQLEAALGKQDPSAEQPKTSGQIDSEGYESLWERYTAGIACLRDSSAKIMTPEKLKAQLDALSILGRGILMALAVRRPQAIEIYPKKTIEDFGRIDVGKEYQFWYTGARAVIKRILPLRLGEFVGLYEYPKKRSKLTNLNFRIADAVRGRYFREEWPVGVGKFEVLSCCKVLEFSDCFCLIEAQCDILDAAKDFFTSSLHKIQQVAQAGLLDSELSTARRLSKDGSPRAACVIAGVVFEKHLNAVIGSRELNMSKKFPGVNDYARKLKGEGVIDVTTCQFLQEFGKLRDKCCNAKSEPTKEEADLMISCVDKIIKTLS